YWTLLWPLMLTPFNVMLGIRPPGENWPLTLVGFSASVSSPSPRSVWPRESVSGRTTPELSQRSANSPFQAPLSSSAQVPTPLPGLPPGLNPGWLHGRQHWPEPTHIAAWLRFSTVAAT